MIMASSLTFAVIGLLSPAAGFFLGIDAGTQGLKALVYDTTAKSVVGLGSKAYGLTDESGSVERPGCAEQSPSVWVDALYEACETALDQAATLYPEVRRQVRGIAVSGQQHGLVALDADFEVIRPSKLWCDTESAAEAEELAAQLGWGVVAAFTSTKLLWLKRNEPQSFARLAHVALPHDYLNYVLTGDLVMECGDASGSGLLDTNTRQWDATAAALIDDQLLTKLPPLIGPTDLAGTLAPDAAAKLGLREGTPVAPGSGDNMMSALGCGCAVEGRVASMLR